MKQSAKNILLLGTLLLLSYIAWDNTRQEQSLGQRLLLTYQTSSSRTSNVNNLCSSYSIRSSLVTASDTSLANGYMSSVDSQVGIDGIGLMRNLGNAKYSDAKSMISNNVKGFAIFIASFAVGLVIIVVIWPFLLCCCCCPSCCPPKCCQRSQNQTYTKCELYWPAFALMLALCLVIGASIYGLIETIEVGQSIKKTSCSMAIIADDILNGNVTMDQSSYFAGLNTISSQLGNLQTNLNNIDGNLSVIRTGSSNATMDNALNDCQTAISDTKKISNNDAAGNNLNLKYSTPIDAIAPPGGPITSSFVSILGSYISQSGYVWTLYTSINNISQVLTNLRNQAQNYHDEISNVSSGIANVSTTISNIINSVQNADNQVGNYYTVSSTNTANDTNIAVIVYYAVVIGLSILSLIAAIFVTCCQKYGCRYLLYGVCFFLFIAGVIGFIFSTFLSLIIPPYTWGCEYYAQSLTNSAYFSTNLNFLMDSNTLSQISVCMPFGNGDLLSTIGGLTTSGIQNLTKALSTLNSFNQTPYINLMNNSMTSAVNIVNSFALSEIPDVTDSSTLTILEGLASPTSGTWSGCNSALSSDSWVPSVNQNSSDLTINCTATNGNSGTSSTCSSGVSTTSSGCNGCMDSGQVLNHYLTGGHVLLTDLTSRYGSSCTFNSELNNVWTNYYKVKETALGPTVGGVPSSTGVLPRTVQVQVDLNTLFTQINILPTFFNSILTNMNSINTLVDPTYGMLAGLNCSLIGQNFARFQQTTCGTLYKDAYLLRFAVGILSYGILFALCFSVCIGARHYKKSLQQKYLSSKTDGVYLPPNSKDSANQIAYNY